MDTAFCDKEFYEEQQMTKTNKKLSTTLKMKVVHVKAALNKTLCNSQNIKCFSCLGVIY